MKNLIFILALLFLAVELSANSDDELIKAYKREFAFLKEQKESLKSQLSKIKKSNSRAVGSAKKDVDKLQSTLLGYNIKIEAEQEKLSRAEMNRDSVSDDNSMVDGVQMQMKTSLKEQGVDLAEEKDSSKFLKNGFETTLPLLTKLQSISKESGNFYLQDGSEVEGEIIRIGNIASYGVSKNSSGALAPAGDGNLKLWNDPLSVSTAKALLSGRSPKELHIFIYETLQKDVAYRTEKTVYEVIDSGRLIGWIIMGLGGFAMLLVFMRIGLLMSSNTDTKKTIGSIINSIEAHDLPSAQQALENFSGSTARVLKATLRNIHRDRDFVEDIIAENILNESSRIDRFGAVILVIAAVAPLLGLLGTVTGMIATFDVITEFGTGDPKLLAGGISVALVTTELGLVVAIPALLLGNLLGGWANSIKDSMEQNALHIVNQYHKSLADRERVE